MNQAPGHCRGGKQHAWWDKEGHIWLTSFCAGAAVLSVNVRTKTHLFWNICFLQMSSFILFYVIIWLGVHSLPNANWLRVNHTTTTPPPFLRRVHWHTEWMKNILLPPAGNMRGSQWGKKNTWICRGWRRNFPAPFSATSEQFPCVKIKHYIDIKSDKWCMKLLFWPKLTADDLCF